MRHRPKSLSGPLGPMPGRDGSKLARHRSNSSHPGWLAVGQLCKSGRTVAEFTRPFVGQVWSGGWPNSGKHRPMLTTVGRTSAEFGQRLTQIDRLLGRFCPKSANIFPTMQSANLATKVARILAKFWSGLAQVRHTSPNLDQIWPNFGWARPTLHRN